MKVKLSRAISSSKLTEITSVVKTCGSSPYCDTCKGNDVKWNSCLSWRGTDLHDREDFLQSCIWLIHSLEWFLIKWNFFGCQDLLWSLTAVEGKCGIVLTASLQKDFHCYLESIFYFAVGLVGLCSYCSQTSLVWYLGINNSNRIITHCFQLIFNCTVHSLIWIICRIFTRMFHEWYGHIHSS